MSNVIDKILDHPIATIVIVSSLTNGAARIISAARGQVVEPIVKVEQHTSK